MGSGHLQYQVLSLYTHKHHVGTMRVLLFLAPIVFKVVEFVRLSFHKSFFHFVIVENITQHA